MEFYTAFNQPRPVRLSERTRNFAWESLHGKYGDDTMQNLYVDLDAYDGFERLSEYTQYDIAVAEIAAKCPVRICDGELVSGAATLGDAIGHFVPARRNGKSLWPSISHVTLGFDRVVDLGVNELEKEVNIKLRQENLSRSAKERLNSMLHTIDSLRVWHNRYLDAVKIKSPEIYQNLLHVPFHAPGSFYEAVQSLWFLFAFTRLCGNWSGIGRIDVILGKYLEKDLENHTVTLEQAREILASFFIKGCEWIQSNTPVGSGDAQHYQNIVLGGMDPLGRDVTNEVTYLVLDIVEELAISDFPITIRMNFQTSDRLKRRVAEVIRHGGGIVAVYNEPLILDSITSFGYPQDEARTFANDGCWEVQIPGKTYFMYHPFDSLQIFLKETLHLHDKPCHFESFEALYAKFREDLHRTVEQIYENAVHSYFKETNGGVWEWKENIPCTVVSLFTDGCIESGRSYLEGGAKYTVISPHIGGAPDVGNSLYAIKKLVFEEKKVTLEELLEAVKNNWNDAEYLRQYVRNKYRYYGNDEDSVDECIVRVLDDFADMVENLNGRCPILFPAGVSTFGRQIEWAPFRTAVPFGYRKGEILSGNSSPTPGTDAEGATALIRSYCKANLKKQPCGAALDVKLYPSTVQGENGITALSSLIDGFIKLGGFFMQLDVMDAEV